MHRTARNCCLNYEGSQRKGNPPFLGAICAYCKTLTPFSKAFVDNGRNCSITYPETWLGHFHTCMHMFLPSIEILHVSCEEQRQKQFCPSQQRRAEPWLDSSCSWPMVPPTSLLPAPAPRSHTEPSEFMAAKENYAFLPTREKFSCQFNIKLSARGSARAKTQLHGWEEGGPGWQ